MRVNGILTLLPNVERLRAKNLNKQQLAHEIDVADHEVEVFGLAVD